MFCIEHSKKLIKEGIGVYSYVYAFTWRMFGNYPDLSINTIPTKGSTFFVFSFGLVLFFCQIYTEKCVSVWADALILSRQMLHFGSLTPLLCYSLFKGIESFYPSFNICYWDVIEISRYMLTFLCCNLNYRFDSGSDTEPTTLFLPKFTKNATWASFSLLFSSRIPK